MPATLRRTTRAERRQLAEVLAGRGGDEVARAWLLPRGEEEPVDLSEVLFRGFQPIVRTLLVGVLA